MQSHSFPGFARLVLLSVLLPGIAACERRDTAIKAAGEASPAPAAGPLASAEARPVLGEAPAWAVTTLDGRRLGRDELLGKVVLIKFWATWCPPCVAEVPTLLRLQEKYAERGLVIVALSADNNPEALARFVEQRGLGYPVARADQELIDLFGEAELLLPTAYVVDREGQVRHRKVGASPESAYDQMLAPLL
jgi:thiol-disulfide isomerase/thioredoxin